MPHPAPRLQPLDRLHPLNPLNRLLTLVLASFLICLAPVDAIAQDQPKPGKQQPVAQDSGWVPSHPADYFDSLIDELQQRWPKNQTIRFVFHGHSVPAGYFKTPRIRRFQSYPSLAHRQLCQTFPTAALDVCVTAIGGEAAVAGAARFEADVLTLKPDVVFIDYSLNDRRLGLGRSEKAWRQMIEACLKRKIRVVLLTPTPDQNSNLLDRSTPLAKHADQVSRLAREYQIPLVDSYAAFVALAKQGRSIKDFMSQVNHPNEQGHQVVARLIVDQFKHAKKRHSGR